MTHTLLFGYYLRMALASLRRNLLLTSLMVVAIGVGIGAAMTTLTVFMVLTNDPLPDRSERVFHPRLDAQDMSGYAPGGEPHDLLTRLDAEQLLREKRGVRQAMMYAGFSVIELDQGDDMPFRQRIRYTSSDFFPMFGVPLQHGQPWSAADDEARARVVVIGADLNQRVFNGGNSVGKLLRINGEQFRVIGVAAPWHPQPTFYDLNREGGFAEADQLFLPFSTSRALRMGFAGNLDCWGEVDKEEGQLGLNSSCAWVQYWVEMASAQDAADFRAYLENHSSQQRQNGRYQRPVNVRLDNIPQWLDYKRVVPSDVRLQTWLAFGFLFICLLNTTGLLLAKFLRRAPEIGLRRALGAPRSSVFQQCLVEAGLIGIAGGAFGLLLAWCGLWLVRQQAVGYAALAGMEAGTLFGTFLLALVASLAAAAFPAWRACLVAPASQLKSL